MKSDLASIMYKNLKEIKKKSSLSLDSDVTFIRNLIKDFINTYSVYEKNYLIFSFKEQNSYELKFENVSDFKDNKDLNRRAHSATNSISKIPNQNYFRSLNIKNVKYREIGANFENSTDVISEVKIEVIRKEATISYDSFIAHFKFSDDYNELSVSIIYDYEDDLIDDNVANKNLKLPYSQGLNSVDIIDLRGEDLSGNFNTDNPPNRYLRVVVRNIDNGEIIESSLINYNSKYLKKYILSPEYKNTETEVIYPKSTNKKSSKIKNRSKKSIIQKNKEPQDILSNLEIYAIGNYVYEAFKDSGFLFYIKIEAFNDKTNLSFCKMTNDESGKLLESGNFRYQKPEDLSKKHIRGIIENYNNSGIDAYLDLEDISFSMGCGSIPIKALLE